MTLVGQAFVAIVGVVVLSLTVGCQPSARRSSSSEEATATVGGESQNEPAKRSSVPLRVWCLADPSAGDMIQRQWQANSDRPLDLKWLSAPELLAERACDCDVLVYPAELLGELVDRQWVSEFPAATKASPALGASGQPADASLAVSVNPTDSTSSLLDSIASSEQTRYGRRTWAISLGVTTPVVLSNFALPAAFSEDGAFMADAIGYWSAVEAALREKVGDKPISSLASDAIDDSALCDRFLVVLMSLSQRESRLGVTLDPESLKARLAGEDALQAAEIIWRLTQLNSQPLAMAGGYEAAWLALQQEQPSLTIGLPPLPTPEVDAVTKISATAPPQSHLVGRAKRTQGWNSGHGLIVSIASACRQTAQSLSFARWLATEPTRTTLAKRWVGIEADSIYPPSSSAWQAQRLVRRLVQQPHLPNEPRWTGAWNYRQILGQALSSMVRGEVSPAEAMKNANQAWDRLVGEKDRKRFRENVEQSLGL